MVDPNAFFRETSHPLNANLDLFRAVRQCRQALKRYMPAEGLAIIQLEPSLKSARPIIWDHDGGIHSDLIAKSVISIPVDTRTQWKKSPLPDARIINRPEDDPVGYYFQEISGQDFSNLVVFLEKDGVRIAIAALITADRDRYTQRDLDLFSMLKEPFAKALDHYLLGQEIIKLQRTLDNTAVDTRGGIALEEIIGHSFGLKNVANLIEMVAPLDSPVLISGETGVGKELISGAIHKMSTRRDGPFICVNCGAIPETLVDSELFGHEKGAFTGAITRRKGRFERAQHGTIFLDEIGELKPDIQVKLLRVLENMEIERVGGSEPIRMDVRIVVATHRNLENMVKEGAFREDLLFRINVFPIVIPPLRARKGDIPALVDHFIQKKSRSLSIHPIPSLGGDAIDMLMDYNWPGNVRELENAVERELIVNRRGPLSFSTFHAVSLEPPKKAEEGRPSELLSLDDLLSAHIMRALDQTNGRISGPNGAAKILGVNPSTLRNKMIRLKIPFSRAQQKIRGK
ncbi:sigma-54 interaction domain-containing protein [Desulfatibacillum aliphaticivorans]|uniref:sigma-54 interaction domain-containing protein n=1 Tax=Desulfatibacillum aliphaticivorans TaxID=218208 RepID=UPI0003FA1913|nr:sigma 54-interacting transcriptional regulator [Desulfatibacillum aliphaticivorans]